MMGFEELVAEAAESVSADGWDFSGGGEVLAGATTFPPTMVATESWPPNIARATARLHPLGVVVVADPGPSCLEAAATNHGRRLEDVFGGGSETSP